MIIIPKTFPMFLTKQKDKIYIYIFVRNVVGLFCTKIRVVLACLTWLPSIYLLFKQKVQLVNKVLMYTY